LSQICEKAQHFTSLTALTGDKNLTDLKLLNGSWYFIIFIFFKTWFYPSGIYWII